MKNLIVFLKLACICLLLTGIGSCAKPPYEVRGFSRADIPYLDVGMWWQYRVTDSLHHRVDTIKMTIVEAANAADPRSYICAISENGVTIDNGHMNVSATTISYSDDTSIGHYTLQLPCEVGQSWGVDQTFNKSLTKVLSHSPALSILGHTYDVYTLSEQSSAQESGFSSEYQMAKNVGLASINYSTIRTGWIGRKNLQLISYHLF